MNLLFTSSRLPVALDEIRKFGRRGHRVFAADTFDAAPGSHSRHVVAHAKIAPPAFAPERFYRDIQQLIIDWHIDLVLPCFEEAFYLARHLVEMSELAPVFTSDFAPLTRLHDKARFNALAQELGILAPLTHVAHNGAELAAALGATPRYFARPAFSRGGLELITNVGPLTGALGIGDVEPTPLHPWVVQAYVDGEDVCTFGVAQHGHLVLHASYVHPRQIENAGGIVFESIIDDEALASVERFVSATGYHGQIGFDFRRSAEGLSVIECNPRPTAGVHLVSDDALVDAVLAPSDGPPHIVPAGRRRLYAAALLRDLVLHRKNRRDDAALLRSARDVYAEPGDRMPALYQFLSYAQVLAYLRRHHGAAPRAGTTLMAAYFDGIAWDGQPIP
ncbi:MAG: ATP-grasp domain-containing protein [Polyangia bacterium]